MAETGSLPLEQECHAALLYGRSLTDGLMRMRQVLARRISDVTVTWLLKLSVRESVRVFAQFMLLGLACPEGKERDQEGPVWTELVTLRSRLREAWCNKCHPVDGDDAGPLGRFDGTEDSYCPSCGGRDIRYGAFLPVSFKVGLVPGTARERRMLVTVGKPLDRRRTPKTDPKTGEFQVSFEDAMLCLREYGKHIKEPRWASIPGKQGHTKPHPIGDRWLVEEPAFEAIYTETRGAASTASRAA